MEVITEYGNYWDLKDHSWSGALDTLADIEKADKEDELMDFLEEVFADRTPTDTEVNDLLWHDREYVYEAVGLNENGEIPTVVDEARENCSNWHVSLAEVKKAGIFEQSLIDYIIDMIQTDEDEQGNPVYDEDEIYWLDFNELESNSNTVTEEQIEWLNANG
jgi:hypothetical protein